MTVSNVVRTVRLKRFDGDGSGLRVFATKDRSGRTGAYTGNWSQAQTRQASLVAAGYAPATLIRNFATGRYYIRVESGPALS